ncbi:hypothetical protein Tco_0995043, partial [Tanacetum coccineum]
GEGSDVVITDDDERLLLHLNDDDLSAIAVKSKRNKSDSTKELNEMKLNLTYMEWYMKKSKAKGG